MFGFVVFLCRGKMIMFSSDFVLWMKLLSYVSLNWGPTRENVLRQNPSPHVNIFFEGRLNNWRLSTLWHVPTKIYPSDFHLIACWLFFAQIWYMQLQIIGIGVNNPPFYNVGVQMLWILCWAYVMLETYFDFSVLFDFKPPVFGGNWCCTHPVVSHGYNFLVMALYQSILILSFWWRGFYFGVFW